MAELAPRAAGAKRLRDKVCVITSAGQGIGRATARRLVAEGGKTVVAELHVGCPPYERAHYPRQAVSLLVLGWRVR